MEEMNRRGNIVEEKEDCSVNEHKKRLGKGTRLRRLAGK